MIATGLEFAPGTTEECKKLVVGLAQPSQILSAYRQSRSQLSTGDIVMMISTQDPSGFQAETRSAYVKRIRDTQQGKLPLLMRALADKSAHGIAQLPAESEAFWLIVARGPKTVPVMCVMFALPYETSAAVN